MEVLRKYYITITVLILGFAVATDYASNFYEPEHKSFVTLDENGNKIVKDYVQYTLDNKILKIASNFCYSISITVFISLLIISKLEKREKENFQTEILNLQEKINKDVLEGIFRKFVPEELFELIKKDVINREAIRKNARWVYDIQSMDNGIKLIQTMNYELHNISNKKIEENLSIDILTSDISRTCISYIKSEGEGKVIHEKKLKKFDESNFKSQDFNIPIKPKSFVTNTLIVETEYFNDHVLDNHTSKHPIIGLNIEINHTPDLRVTPIQTFSAELIENPRTDTKIIYKHIEAIMPGQGLQYTIDKISKSEEVVTSI